MTSPLAEFALIAISSWLPILNPLALLPQFTSFTRGLPVSETHHIAKRATMVAGTILVLTSLLGSAVFIAFGITVPAFRLAGGVILFLIALEMLRANPLRYRTTAEEEEESLGRQDVAVFPLAIPLIAGPGSITTSLILGEVASGFTQFLVLLAILGVGMIVMFFCLKYADVIMNRVGSIGKNAMSRIMGIILAAVAAQFIIDAVTQVAATI